MRGHKYPMFPWSKFFKACRRQSHLLLVDEHRTSKLCSSCGFKDASSAKLVKGPSQCLRTKRCPEGSCRFSVAVGRDGGSARSIHRVTRYIMLHGCRPTQFASPFAKNVVKGSDAHATIVRECPACTVEARTNAPVALQSHY